MIRPPSTTTCALPLCAYEATMRRIASLALVCACIGGCPDDASEDGVGEGDHGASASAGMSGSDPACEMPFGGYDVAFEALGGRCGALATRSVRINSVSLLIEKFAELDVETEIIVEGCAVAITQITRDKQGIPTEQVRGQGLTVRDDGTIVGIVTGTLYDDAGQVSCSSDYQTTLTPNGVFVSGEEVGAAGSGGSSGGAFSEQHAAEIQRDCNESVNCSIQRDEQLEENPFEKCIADSARALDGDQQLQVTFLANFERCKAFIVCDYFECVVSAATN